MRKQFLIRNERDFKRAAELFLGAPRESSDYFNIARYDTLLRGDTTPVYYVREGVWDGWDIRYHVKGVIHLLDDFNDYYNQI